VLTNLPDLEVRDPTIPFTNAPPTPPSGKNPWPALVAFVNGNFLVSDMRMSIKGQYPFPKGYIVFTGFPTFTDMFLGFSIVGTTANASFLRVEVKGEKYGFGYNFVNGIIFWGLTGPTAPPISGSFVVRDSRFQYVYDPTPVINVSHASILIGHNNSNSVGWGMEIVGLADSRCEFLLNTVEDSFDGVDVYDNVLAGTAVHVTSSEILISNNVFSGGQYGVNIGADNPPGATFEGGATCQILANTFQKISNEGIGIYLGPNTSHCIVAGNSPTTIQNLGTDNVIVNKGSAP